MNGKKKEQLMEILLSHLQSLRGKKRYLPRLLSALIAIPVFCAVYFVRPLVSYETYQLFVLLLLLLALLGGFILSKYEKSLRDKEIDQKT